MTEPVESHTQQPNAPRRLIRLPEVMARVGLKRSAIYQRMSEGRFPRSRSLGPRYTVWIESEIESWICAAIASDSDPNQISYVTLGAPRHYVRCVRSSPRWNTGAGVLLADWLWGLFGTRQKFSPKRFAFSSDGSDAGLVLWVWREVVGQGDWRWSGF